MKQIKVYVFTIVALLCISTTNAQLLGKLKKAATDANNAAENVNAIDKAVKGSKGKSGGSSSTGSGGLKLDWSTYKLTPSVTFNSLLYGTFVGIDGFTRFDSYTACFIPGKTTNGSEVNTISDQADYLKIKVYKGDQFITYFEYSGNQKFDDGKKIKFNAPTSRYQRDGEWVGDTNIDLKKWGTGMYRLDFYAGDKMFYSFDFEVYKLTNNDAYAEVNEMYLARGPWNNYAYLNNAENGNLIFGFYLNHEEFLPFPSNARKTLKPVKWSLKMFKDNKPFAQHYGTSPNTAQVERAEWKEFSCALKSGDKGSEIKFNSLTDGAYRVELSLANEKKPRVYNFNVKNNKIELSAEQDRAKNTDPTHLIEGWNDYVWLKLAK